MADLPEISEWTEGVRALEPTDPVRNDVVNDLIQPLINRTNWLRDNGGQSGGVEEAPEDDTPYARMNAEWVPVQQGGGGSSPVVWLEGNNSVLGLETLTPGTMYILDSLNGNWLAIEVPLSDSFPLGSEFHFVCAGSPEDLWLYQEEL